MKKSVAENHDRTRRWPPFSPVDGASVGLFRIAFGLLMLVEVWRFVHHGWITSIYVAPPLHFTWPGFGWVRPWPGAGMHLHFVVLAIAAACLAAGIRTRIAAAVLWLGWTYVFLVERAAYLNHLYLICLVAFLFAIIPPGGAFRLRRRVSDPAETIPRWGLWLLRFQIGVPYVYGGFAKLNGDFLRGAPLWMWTTRMEHLAWLPGFGSRELAVVASYLATGFDLLVVPLLLWRRTRPYAFAVAVAFHLANVVLFRIGVFPWMMIAATTLFLEPDWPRRLFRKRPLDSSRPTSFSHGSTISRRAVVAFLSVWVAAQLLVPFRHLLVPGRVDWTEEAYYFSWRMMLIDKASAMRFEGSPRGSGRRFAIDPRRYGLTRQQLDAMSRDPELIRQFSRFAAEVYPTPGLEVRAVVITSLNGRRPQWMVDPTVDLAAEPSVWGHATWIAPLREPLPKEPFLEPQSEWLAHVPPWEEWSAE